MAQSKPYLLNLLLLVALLFLAGCPQTPQLTVSPAAVQFGTGQNESSFTILNSDDGNSTLEWTLEEVVRATPGDPNSDWVVQNVPWLTIDSPASGSTREVNVIELAASRLGLPVGVSGNAGVRVTTTHGDVQVVPVSIEVQPSLALDRSVISLSPTDTTGSFSITNLGTETLTWSILYLDDPSNVASARAIPSDISVSPNPGSTPVGDTTTVTVTFPEGHSDFGLLVQSQTDAAIVTFVFGAVLEGLSIEPEIITLYADNTPVADGEAPPAQAPTVVRVVNSSGTSLTWSLELRGAPGIDAVPITASVLSGTTSAASESEIVLTVSDGLTVLSGSGNYELVLRSGDSFLSAPINVEIMPLPFIAISRAPEDTVGFGISELTILDFGRDEIQLQFWIVNIGSLGSNLYFNITYEGQGSETSLIQDVNPLQGGANGSDQDFIVEDSFVDGVPVTVTINRSNMEEDVEFRTITIEAMDIDFSNVIASVPPATINIRVERQPLTVEGAINRSRPPYVMRFVFLLRDTLGQVIPTVTEADKERITFNITENEVPLDLNEVNMFVEGPENLRVNLIVMLDFTGSMLHAGTDDETNPLLPGEALGQVIESTKAFLDDLPSSYRVALMYYNDRQQLDRVIHSFTTDRTSLKKALDDFELPTNLFGVSDIRDALMDGISILNAEDPPDTTLPFDGADVKAIMFVTDGQDNASLTQFNALIGVAEETQVRLYPLSYTPAGAPSNADLIVMAHDSGGHLYNAGSAQNLSSLLANQQSLGLEEVLHTDSDADNIFKFNISNLGDTLLSWEISIDGGSGWLTSVFPMSGNTAVGSTTPVAINLNSSALNPNERVQAVLNITSASGEGTVNIIMDTGDDVAQVDPDGVTLTLRDDPGLIWEELQNQVVLTYATPSQSGGTYNVGVRWDQGNDKFIEGSFEKDGAFALGDVRAGQIALNTTGIVTDPVTGESRAEIYVRADYVPRGVNRFRMRFFINTPEGFSEGFPPNFADTLATTFAATTMDVELAPEGILVAKSIEEESWRLLSEADGAYRLVTDETNALPYAAFGNLLRITISGLDDYVALFADLPRQPEFTMGMRVDNQIYVSPATPGTPSETKFFLYPGGPTFLERELTVTTLSDVAPPAQTILGLAVPGIDPEAESAWDMDLDGLPDFMDPVLDDDSLPGKMVFPNPLDIASQVQEVTLQVTNNRLDTFTFTWDIELGTMPEGVLSFDGVAPADFEAVTLAPGQVVSYNLQVNRDDLTAGSVLDANLLLQTDRAEFGTEVIPVTVTVQAN